MITFLSVNTLKYVIEGNMFSALYWINLHHMKTKWTWINMSSYIKKEIAPVLCGQVCEWVGGCCVDGEVGIVWMGRWVLCGWGGGCCVDGEVGVVWMGRWVLCGWGGGCCVDGEVGVVWMGRWVLCGWGGGCCVDGEVGVDCL